MTTSDDPMREYARKMFAPPDDEDTPAPRRLELSRSTVDDPETREFARAFFATDPDDDGWRDPARRDDGDLDPQGMALSLFGRRKPRPNYPTAS